jgi:glycosyltransferase involved in cell wall biosynthesis
LFPVSVAIVTRNEEVNIEDALKSVSDADEIVVIDAFSTDRTVEICRKYTGSIYQFEWEGYARQKQKAVDLTSGEWVLVLDADERVTPELKKEITDLLSDSPDVNGFFIPRKNYFLGKWIRHGGWWPDHTLRLFRKDQGGLEQREVHEKITVKGPVGYLRNPLVHYTYWSISEFTARMEHYSSLSATEIRNRAGRAGIMSLIFKPLATLLKMYLLRLGFLDGTRGLMLAVLYSHYTFLKYAKTWEKQLESGER